VIGLFVVAVLLVIALWLVFINPRFIGRVSAPAAVAPAAAPPSANIVVQNQLADEAVEKVQAEAKAAKAAKALAAERAAEAAQADAIEQNMTPAENRLNDDYVAQVGDTRPAADAGSTPPDRGRP